MVKGKFEWRAYIDWLALVIGVYLHASAWSINYSHDLHCELITLLFSEGLLVSNYINLAKIIELQVNQVMGTWLFTPEDVVMSCYLGLS